MNRFKKLLIIKESKPNGYFCRFTKCMQFRIILLAFFALSSLRAFTQEVKVYDTFDDFVHELNKKDDKVYVVNFWATWCAPCVKELPYFEELGKKYPNVEILLVSLDFKNQLDSRLKPFLAKKSLESRVVVMGDPKANSWIDRVDPDWSGTVPATVVYRKNKKKFFEKEFNSLSELEEIVLPFLK